MLNDHAHLHFIGVGGIGVSALARLSKLLGKQVTGSDIRESVVTQSLAELGCRIFIGHDKANLAADTDLVIHSEDVNPSSAGFVELEAAQGRGIRTLRYSEALSLFMEGKYGIGVSGTNGKSTTTAILALIMEKAGTDPMVVIGSRLSPLNESEHFKANARFGQGQHFIYEADEYHRHMLDSQPSAAVITNIEEDHLDYYKGIDDIKSAFAEFVSRLPTGGVLVYNSDDPHTAEVCAGQVACKKASFSMDDPKADYQAGRVSTENQTQIFNVVAKGRDLGTFKLRIPGPYNLMNALGAVAMALEQGVDPEVVKSALGEFNGIWRRFETVGEYKGKVVISDYAHHPTAISGLMSAARQFYPNKKILLVFQPHQKNRTKRLFHEFVHALKTAGPVILPEIYFVPGREKAEDNDISSRQLVEELSKGGISAEYAKDLDQAQALIDGQIGGIDILVLAGAGTIDQLARKLAKSD
jgi:UDP-N-acetylmuramate--alanine ligase